MAMNWTDQGGYLANVPLNKEFRTRAQPLLRFRQFCSYKEDFGKGKGASINWDKIGNVSTRGGTLIETNTMHKTDIPITKGTLAVDEAGNSIPYTRKGMALAAVDFEAILRGGLMNDRVKVIDGMVERQFNATPLRYVGSAATTGVVTTNGTATAVGTGGMKAYHLRKMIVELQTRNVPGFDSAQGDYAAIFSTEAMEELFADLESLNKYVETGHKKIAAGEVGRYFGCRLIQDNYATRYVTSASARTQTAVSWTSNSKPGYVFGADTCREGIVIPEEIRRAIPGDFGRAQGLAWYWLGGFQIEWSDEPNARIIKWDSAS